jgi:hypothetical protein
MSCCSIPNIQSLVINININIFSTFLFKKHFSTSYSGYGRFNAGVSRVVKSALVYSMKCLADTGGVSKGPFPNKCEG